MPRPSTAKIYAVLSDVHVPFQDHKAVSAVCDFLGDLRPHGLVFNGDILDFGELSSHNTGSVAKLENNRIAATWKAGNEFLEQVKQAAGKRVQEQHWIDGNHEHRLDRWIASGDHAVFAGDKGLDLSHRLAFKRRHITHHAGYPDAHLKLGHLLITHGRFTGRYAASRHLDYYRHSILIGHTHCPQSYHAAGFVKQGAYVQGHLADPNSPAVDYVPKINGWVQGFSVVHVQKSGDFQVQLVNLHNGVFFVGDRCYGG